MPSPHHPPKGIYQHFKGNRYELIDIARSSETLEELVVYRALYGDFGLLVRPLQMFQEMVPVNDTMVPRFKLVASQTSEK